MTDVKIIVDTSSDIPEDIREKYNIGLLSFLSIFGEVSYVSGSELSNEKFYELLERSEKIPTTAQTPYQDMYDYLIQEAKAHKSVIYFTISSKGSGQYQTACLVREEILEEYPQADIRIVDSQKYSLYIAMTAVYAALLAKEDVDVDEIIEKCGEYINKWKCYLLVDTLKYLEKGGRINKASAVVGTLLDIKPILTIENGLVESMDKLRGKKRLVDKLIEKIEDDPDFDRENPRFLVVQSDKERGDEACEKLRDEYGEDCVKMYSEFGPIVGTHVGKGAFAIIIGIK
ncbi:MAG: DegV family protein [Clostridiales bacterium]|nr:DegV family protein [Clostridiales bacterium]